MKETDAQIKAQSQVTPTDISRAQQFARDCNTPFKYFENGKVKDGRARLIKQLKTMLEAKDG